MKISDKEKNEVINYLKADKPLPEKYKFLLFKSTDDVELSWFEKQYNLVNTSLPFQYIEHVDTPRSEKNVKLQQDLFDFSGRQSKGWTNKLIWGDSKLVLSSLKNGPLFEEIKNEGGIKLVYIDPPFDTDADFTFNINLREKTFPKKQSIIEEVAYRDTWGKGLNSFNQMIYERLILIANLLADDGAIFVHCDWRVNIYLRIMLDEIFGKENFQNEIIWKRSSSKLKALSKTFLNVNDYILYYSKSSNKKYNLKYWNYSEEYKKRFTAKDEHGLYYWAPIGSYSKERYDKLKKLGRLQHNKNRMPRIKNYLHEGKGVPPDNLWLDIDNVNSQAKERVNYPTQKPEKLLERIIETSSDENDLIADFFCGSGTTLAVAEKLNRKWIGCDLGKFAIHISRKRLIETQRELKKKEKSYRAFEVLNLGKYERQYYVKMFDINKSVSGKIEKIKFDEFKELILEAYNAKKTNGFKFFDGKKYNSLIHIGPVDYPVTKEDLLMIIEEAKSFKITSVHILAFEYEMGLFPAMINEAKQMGITIEPKKIPHEVFDRRVIDSGEVKFFDVSYIDVKVHIKKQEIAVELLKYVPNYTQENTNLAIEKLKNNKKKIIIENSNVIEISKVNNKISRKSLIKNWSDWIDYWSVDFDYESKLEIIQKKINGKIIYEQTGNFIFENEWQDFIYRNNSKIQLKTPFHPLKKGSLRIAIRVIDIFANDTMIIKDLNN